MFLRVKPTTVVKLVPYSKSFLHGGRVLSFYVTITVKKLIEKPRFKPPETAGNRSHVISEESDSPSAQTKQQPQLISLKT